MSSKEMSLEVGLKRRLSLPAAVNTRASDLSDQITSSFAYRYIVANRNYEDILNVDAISYDIKIVSILLSLAHYSSIELANKYLDHFIDSRKFDVKFVQHILNGNVELDEASTSKYTPIDKSLLTIDDVDIEQKTIRKCYEKAFANFNVTLPFDKEQMDRLLKQVSIHRDENTIKTLEDLKVFTYNFLSKTWPLFSPKVLQIIFSYFKYQVDLNYDCIVSDYADLKKFGLERLHGRLIILRAINGNSDCKKFVLNDIEIADVGFEQKQVSLINDFLNGLVVSDFEIEEGGSGNPIEDAIFNSIYINLRRNELDFLRRLQKCYEIDNNIIYVLNWDEYYRKDVKALRAYYGSSLVFLASILVSKFVRTHFNMIDKQYGVGGAGADLRKYSTHVRNKTKLVSVFLNSFNTLSLSANARVFHFLMSPGMLDRIANIFPSNINLSELDKDLPSALRVLETKIICINYARKKKIIDDKYAEQMLAEVRRAYRQVRFEIDENEGRIRINANNLSEEIYRWFTANRHRFVASLVETDFQFTKLIQEANADLMSPNLCSFICFSNPSGQISNRYAFDIQLGDKLRHNFIALRLKDKIEGVLSTVHADEELKEYLNEAVDEITEKFCEKWITIYEKRSFFRRLRNRTFEAMCGIEILDDNTFLDISSSLAEYYLAEFDSLLGECRNAWESIYFPEMECLIKECLVEFPGTSQVIIDRLLVEIEIGFLESSKWMRVNHFTYPGNIPLKELLYTETYQLKQQKKFRRNFYVNFYKLRDVGSATITSRDIKLPGKYIEGFVAIIDNLIANACSNSYLGVNTPVYIEVLEVVNGLNVKVINEISMEHIKDVRSRVINAKQKLREHVNEQRMRDRGGTGLFRVRWICQDVFGEKFEINIDDAKLSKGKLAFVCNIPDIEFQWESLSQ